VPGPQRPLYAAGRRLLEILPYVPIAGHVRIGVAIFSYDGGLTFGVTGDYDEAPDIDLLCRGIEQSMRELVLAAEREAERDRKTSSVRVRNRSRRRASGGRAANGDLSGSMRGDPPPPR
jgi:diacylglycerol O-acyltransferase / wax synthase